MLRVLLTISVSMFSAVRIARALIKLGALTMAAPSIPCPSPPLIVLLASSWIAGR
jgi:hypothetical protein